MLEHLRHRLFCALQAMDGIYAHKLEHLSVTPRQVAVMEAIHRNPDYDQTRLTEATGVDRSTMTDICLRLEARGLIARKRDNRDRRRYCMALTSAGEDLLGRALAVDLHVDLLFEPSYTNDLRRDLKDFQVAAELTLERLRSQPGRVAA
jgi:DNA-binding MarR family transcriptional regulator